MQVACIDEDKPLKRLAFVRAQGSFWLTWVRPCTAASPSNLCICGFLSVCEACQSVTPQRLPRMTLVRRGGYLTPHRTA